jgi:MFS transporter, SP family, arabinose:H+ symporter
MLAFGAIPALVALELRACMPASRRWLTLKERYAATRKALGILGIDASEEQVWATAKGSAAKERAPTSNAGVCGPGVK